MNFDYDNRVIEILAKYGFSQIVKDEEELDEYDVLSAYLGKKEIVYGEYICTRGGYHPPLLDEYVDLVNDYKNAAGDLLNFAEIFISNAPNQDDYDETDKEVNISFKLDGKSFQWSFIAAEDDEFIADFSVLMSQKLNGNLFFEGGVEGSLVAYVAPLELGRELQEVGDFEIDTAEELFEEEY